MRKHREQGREDARRHLESWQELGYDSPQAYLARSIRNQREDHNDLQNHVKYPRDQWNDLDFVESQEDYQEGWEKGTQETAAEMGVSIPTKHWWHIW